MEGHSCESELHICLENDGADQVFQEAAFSWHQDCDSYISHQPTTPVVTPLASYVGDDYCFSTVDAACVSAEVLLDNCIKFAGDDARFTSCTCDPAIVRLEYTCQFLGNTSCLGAEATLSEVIGYSCSNFGQVMSSATVR